MLPIVHTANPQFLPAIPTCIPGTKSQETGTKREQVGASIQFLAPELERIVKKALEKDREVRYQHASDVATDLRRLRRDTESGKTTATQASTDKTLKRPGLWVVVAACIAALGLAAVGSLYVRSVRKARIDSIAVLPFTNWGGDANTDYLSDGITESLIDNLAHVPELKVRSRNSVFRYKGKALDV